MTTKEIQLIEKLIDAKIELDFAHENRLFALEKKSQDEINQIKEELEE